MPPRKFEKNGDVLKVLILQKKRHLQDVVLMNSPFFLGAIFALLIGFRSLHR